MMHYIIGYLIESGETLGGLAALAGLASIHPTTRKLAYVLMRYGKRHAPRWALVLMAAPIIGPFDEMAAIAGIGWMLRNPRKRAILRRYLAAALR